MKSRPVALAFVIWLLLILFFVWGGIRDIIVVYIITINLLAAGYIAWDKWMAMIEAWRTPESLLLTLSFLGGSPLAWITMQLIRHKTVKTSFRMKFLAVAIVQSILIAVILWYRWR
jgi:uncharacterized membrane protein YsdA (DUF1294 family)